MKPGEAVTEALKLLDTMPREVTSWEASFLNSMLTYGCHTPRQHAKLAQLVDKYLPEKLLGAEIMGQERLL